MVFPIRRMIRGNGLLFNPDLIFRNEKSPAGRDFNTGKVPVILMNARLSLFHCLSDTVSNFLITRQTWSVIAELISRWVTIRRRVAEMGSRRISAAFILSANVFGSCPPVNSKITRLVSTGTTDLTRDDLLSASAICFACA